jgi:hypothetical protein
VFWHFHGWIDDRIEDWFRAHERFTRAKSRGCRSMACHGLPRGAGWKSMTRGSADTHGCSTTPGLQVGKSVEMDPETMKLALRITFITDEEKLAGLFRACRNGHGMRAI